MKRQQQQSRETKSFNLNHMQPGWRRAVRCCGLLATLALALAVAPRAGATITVTTLNDSGPGSLRQAIADAPPGDTIDFAVTGTITLTSGELVITNDLTISGPGPTNLTISGNNASRVFSFTNVTAAISGVTVADGRVVYRNGAGIYIASGSLVVSNCVVTANVQDAPSSGVYGAGIFNGGGLTIINSTVSNNHAGGYGGGISSFGTLRVINSTVTTNSGMEGAGLWVMGSCFITNTTISGNMQPQVFSYICTVWLCNSTVSPNTAKEYSVVVTATSTLHFFNSILAGKFFVNPIGSSAISHDFNLIQNTNDAIITGVTTHNIYGKDPLLGPLADNGGPTPTHALLPGSPAIDHGSSGGLTTDQRGQPRPFNFPAYTDADDGSDIGAYELQERAQTGPVFTVNTTDDVDDGVPGIAHCSLREAINAANTTPGTNTINFATAIPGLMNGVTGTITLANGQLTVTNSVNINGPGAANLTVSGNNASRVFRFQSVPFAMFTDLTIANGKATPQSDYNGGGIYSLFSTLAVSNCAFTNNTAEISGGGIFSSGDGVLAIRSCTFSKNRTESGGGSGGGIWVSGSMSAYDTTICLNSSVVGGGIYSYSGGILELTNCTISGNYGSYCGGISANGSCAIWSSTVCSNGSGLGVGGIVNQGKMDVGNTILAGNTGSPPDCSGTLNSLDYNLIQNTNGCTITNLTAHNIYNQDPKLGPLADLGGPTSTHALRFDSPAIDAGNSGGLTTDQRGLPRPIDDPSVANAEGGDGSDIGTYEADPNLRILVIEKVGSDIRLRFNTVLGLTYRVESKDRLEDPWTTLVDDIAGTGSGAQVLDTGAASLPKRFYRVVAPFDLAADLVALWLFSGNANDSSGNGNNGVIVNAVFVADQHTNPASALDFNPSNNSYVSVADSPSLDILSGISLSLWINPRSLPAGGPWMLLGKSDYSTHTDYLLRILSSGDLQWEYKYYHYTSSHPITAGQWHHIVVTAQSPTGAKQIFVDGVAVSFNQVSTAPQGTVPSPLTIGCARYWSAPWSEHFDGAIDDVRIYNRALNATEIITLYNQEK